MLGGLDAHVASCQRSHAGLQGKLETLDPHVQMQLLRRGGLEGMKAETRESATEKIKGLRAAVAADKEVGRECGERGDQGRREQDAQVPRGPRRVRGDRLHRDAGVPPRPRRSLASG